MAGVMQSGCSEIITVKQYILEPLNREDGVYPGIQDAQSEEKGREDPGGHGTGSPAAD